jgi:uncharacterized protein
MIIPVEISSLAVDGEQNSPLVILKESFGSRFCAVPVGPLEACAIAMNSLPAVSEKNNAINVLTAVIAELGARLYRAVLFKSGTGIGARIHLMRDGSVKTIACSCGDAIGLAVRCAGRLFAEESLFENGTGEEQRSDVDTLRMNISNVDTVEFGRYFLE